MPGGNDGACIQHWARGIRCALTYEEALFTIKHVIFPSKRRNGLLDVTLYKCVAERQAGYGYP